MLLAVDGRILDDNLRAAHTSRVELHQALRLHGVGSLEDVGAVVLERNGTMSVLGRDRNRDPDVFTDVISAEGRTDT